MDIRSPDHIPAVRVILGHNGWLDRKGDISKSWFGENIIGLLINIFLNNGYQHCDFQTGTIITPRALSKIIFWRTLGILANEGKAQNLKPVQFIVNASMAMETGSHNA